jgi:hypothetical protein
VVGHAARLLFADPAETVQVAVRAVSQHLSVERGQIERVARERAGSDLLRDPVVLPVVGVGRGDAAGDQRGQAVGGVVGVGARAV